MPSTLHADSWVPRYAFLTRGAGTGDHPLAAFDAALRAAGVSGQNLVPVSSVLPPACRLISRARGLKMLRPGQITFCVMARMESNRPGTTVAAALGLAAPKNRRPYGYLAEHHATGQDEHAAIAAAERIAVTLLAGKLGIAPSRFKHAMKKSIAATARVPRAGSWTSVVALCVFECAS